MEARGTKEELVELWARAPEAAGRAMSEGVTGDMLCLERAVAAEGKD